MTAMNRLIGSSLLFQFCRLLHRGNVTRARVFLEISVAFSPCCVFTQKQPKADYFAALGGLVQQGKDKKWKESDMDEKRANATNPKRVSSTPALKL